MKLSQMASSDTTELEFVTPDGDKTGVVISGFTPDSKEWKNYQKELTKGNTKLQVYFDKETEERRVDINTDEETREKQLELLAKVVTNITGLDDWEFSPAAVLELFKEPQYSWMFEQWRDHLDSRKNFFAKPAKPVRSTPKRSAG